MRTVWRALLIVAVLFGACGGGRGFRGSDALLSPSPSGDRGATAYRSAWVERRRAFEIVEVRGLNGAAERDCLRSVRLLAKVESVPLPASFSGEFLTLRVDTLEGRFAATVTAGGDLVAGGRAVATLTCLFEYVAPPPGPMAAPDRAVVAGDAPWASPCCAPDPMGWLVVEAPDAADVHQLMVERLVAMEVVAPDCVGLGIEEASPGEFDACLRDGSTCEGLHDAGVQPILLRTLGLRAVRPVSVVSHESLVTAMEQCGSGVALVPGTVLARNAELGHVRSLAAFVEDVKLQMSAQRALASR